MTQATVLAVLPIVLACLAGCASPTQPDPRIPPVVGSPTRLAVSQWKFGARITEVRVEATWGTLYSTSKDVTNDATWRSSDAAILRVRRSGEIESVSPGDAVLTIEYRDVTVSELMRVFSGESPLLVLTPLNSTYVSATVRDATRPSGSGIEGVFVEILSGHNAGRTATTDASGFYYFYPPFVCGPVTARASKPGYRDRVASSVMCENGMPDLSLTPIR